MSEPRLIRLDDELLAESLTAAAPPPGTWVRGSRQTEGVVLMEDTGVLAARMLEPERLLGRLRVSYPSLRDGWRQTLGENLIDGGGVVAEAGPEHLVMLFTDVETAVAAAVLAGRLVAEVWPEGLTPETGLAVEWGPVTGDSRGYRGEAIGRAVELAGRLARTGIVMGESAAARAAGLAASGASVYELGRGGTDGRVFAVTLEGTAHPGLAHPAEAEPPLAPQLERDRLLGHTRRAMSGDPGAMSARCGRALGAALEHGDRGRAIVELQGLAGALSVRDPAEALRLAATAQHHHDLAGVDLSGSAWADWLDDRLEAARAKVGHQAAQRLQEAGASLALRDAALRAFRAVDALDSAR